MTKEEFINQVAESLSIRNKEANAYLNAVVQTLSEVLKKGDSLRLNGLGTFRVKTRSARTGRNPQTGQSLTIPATQVVHFSPAKELKEKVNLLSTNRSK